MADKKKTSYCAQVISLLRKKMMIGLQKMMKKTQKRM